MLNFPLSHRACNKTREPRASASAEISYRVPKAKSTIERSPFAASIGQCWMLLGVFCWGNILSYVLQPIPMLLQHFLVLLGFFGH
ncbi:MAG: hypothetical protein Q8M57_10015 [Nitrosomonas sp.]|uniref:hypothetical protein n=1 Tax=Nitrosomonas sp. TaxID=42353 RepID=UPI002734A9C6|nr:hypothetical protein [Nitrosomonas sp.]MDP3281363.1 hypothetical protein [Nitrosomonas sp.]